MSKKSNSHSEIRCIKDKDKLFGLMKKDMPTDCAHTILEQIATEELIKSSFLNFIDDKADDPE